MRSRVWAVALAAAGLAAGVPSARAADETTNYRVSPQHDNALVGSTLRPPLRVRWEVALGLTSSNLIVAGGRCSSSTTTASRQS